MTDEPHNDTEAKPNRARDYQAGHTYTSAEITRRIREHRPQTAADRLAADMAALLEQHHRETVARRALAGDSNPTDADPLDYVRTIAENYVRHRDLPDIEAMYLDLAAELTLDDARAIRLAAEAVAKATPRIIHLANTEDGKNAQTIADELGVTESYVYRVLREQRTAAEADLTPDRDEWHAFWTVEQHEDGEWREQTTQSAKTTNAPDALAATLLDQVQRAEGEDARLRVTVWKFGESEEGFPLAVATTADDPIKDPKRWVRAHDRLHNRGEGTTGQ